MPYKKIICGVTGSAHAQKAALEAARLAKQSNAGLVYVYAVDLAFLSGGNLGSLSQGQVEASLQNLGRHILDWAGQIAESEGVRAGKILRTGKALDVLRQVVSEEKADLLVLGHEDRTFFEKALFKGSIEDHVDELKARTGAAVQVVR